VHLLDGSDLRLQKVSADVVSFDHALSQLLAEMYDTLDSKKGAIGLAAPQVGVLQRVIVFSMTDGRRGHLINPTWRSISSKKRTGLEGCLSFPGKHWKVRRAVSVTVNAFDRYGVVKIVTGHGLMSQMLQHEIDHLDGILLSTRRDAILQH